MTKRICYAIGALLLTACSPAELQLFDAVTADARQAGEARGLDDDGLYRLRMCESSDRYDAVDPSGKFRGAYQFSRSTWDSVAGRWFPWLEGRDPAEVEPWWQDRAAQALWSERGRYPWPTCGLRV